jgi:hypothetical protein
LRLSWSVILGPVMMQNIMVGSTGWSKAAHYVVVRKQDRQTGARVPISSSRVHLMT